MARHSLGYYVWKPILAKWDRDNLARWEAEADAEAQAMRDADLLQKEASKERR